MKLLVKFPTRERPELFFSTLERYIMYSGTNTQILVSMDTNDPTMNNDLVREALDSFNLTRKRIIYHYGESRNKVDAINRDIDNYDFDVLLIASDDMFPFDGYDTTILEDMAKYYPDTDGALWYNDSDQQRVCTLAVMGKRYYDRFKYVYNPEYISLWCDNEYTEVARKLKKIKYLDKKIIRHEHPHWGGGVKMDPLYEVNETYFSIDKKTFLRRRSKGFPR